MHMKTALYMTGVLKPLSTQQLQCCLQAGVPHAQLPQNLMVAKLWLWLEGEILEILMLS